MSRHSRPTAFRTWLASQGLNNVWLADRLGWSYPTIRCIQCSMKPITDRFVVRCFNRILELPADVFEAQGYLRDGEYVYKILPLKPFPEEEVKLWPKNRSSRSKSPS